MGGTRSSLIKRTSKRLLEEDNPFSEDFKINKKLLGNMMPGKKIRNKIAGYIVNLKKIEKKNEIIKNQWFLWLWSFITKKFQNQAEIA